MSKRLPDRPSLEQLKNQARDLQKAHNSGATDTTARLREFLPRCAELSTPEIAAARLSLRDAQLVTAREYGYGSWRELKGQVQEEAASFDDLFRAVEAQPEPVARIARALQETPDELGLLMVSLGEARAALVMKYLSDAEIEKTVQAIGRLDAVNEADSQRALAALERRLSTDEPVAEDQPVAPSPAAGHGDFILGALGQAVGEKRAREMMQRQGIEAGGPPKGTKPVLDQEYLQQKDAFIRRLHEQPAHELDLDGVRRTVVGLAEIARSEGVLALEQTLDGQLDPLLRYGLQLAVDGTESHVTAEMLTTRAETLVQELETRCRMIVAGVRAIQNDENPRIVDQRLAAFYQKPLD